MDYEKKYKEALERAKSFKTPELCDVAEYIFPELRESEDERIRKEIIEHCRNTRCVTEERVERIAKWIAWLEKQGSEPNWCHHKVDLSNCSEEYRKAYYDGWNNCNMQHSQCKSDSNDVIKCLINGMKFYYEGNEEATWGTDKWSMPVKHIIEVLEQILANSAKTWKDEQKPADSYCQENCKGFQETGKCFADGDCKAKREAEQKSAWNEEDDYNLQCCIAKVQNDIDNGRIGRNRELLTWLKSLKERVLPQPKQEWSEEDEKYINDLIAYFAADMSLKHTEEDIVNWLKSLRPQSQWRPSDEQIKVLEFFIPYVTKCSIVLEKSKGTLLSLLSDLKKLKG